MNNRIVANRFSGKKIKKENGIINILINCDRLELMPEIVDHVKIVYRDRNSSVVIVSLDIMQQLASIFECAERSYFEYNF